MNVAIIYSNSLSLFALDAISSSLGWNVTSYHYDEAAQEYCKPLISVDVVLLSVPDQADLIAVANRIAGSNPGLPIVAFLSNEIDASPNPELPSVLVGLVAPNATVEQIKSVLFLVAAGHSVRPPKYEIQLRSPRPQVKRDSRLDSLLTPREREILREIAKGRSNKAVGQILRISANTVEAHVSAILHKLKARNRTEAALMLGQDEGPPMTSGSDAPPPLTPLEFRLA